MSPVVVPLFLLDVGPYRQAIGRYWVLFLCIFVVVWTTLLYWFLSQFWLCCYVLIYM